jgi:hypothetical protein
LHLSLFVIFHCNAASSGSLDYTATPQMFTQSAESW